MKMKIILFIAAFILVSFCGFSQGVAHGTPGILPSTGNINSTSVIAGTQQAIIGYIDAWYTDTTAANNIVQNIKRIPFFRIGTLNPYAEWYRDTTQSKWIQLATGSGGSVNIYNSDGSLIGNRTENGTTAFGLSFNNNAYWSVGETAGFNIFSNPNGEFDLQSKDSHGNFIGRLQLLGGVDTTAFSLYGFQPYLNFGNIHNFAGFGLRDSLGIMEYKDSFNRWIAFKSIGVTGSPTLQQVLNNGSILPQDNTINSEGNNLTLDSMNVFQVNAGTGVNFGDNSGNNWWSGSNNSITERTISSSNLFTTSNVDSNGQRVFLHNNGTTADTTLWLKNTGVINIKNLSGNGTGIIGVDNNGNLSWAAPTSLSNHTNGQGILGGVYNGSSPITWQVDSSKYATLFALNDTASILRGLINTKGTVTSIATGYGLTGGTITTTGTLLADTTSSNSLVSKLRLTNSLTAGNYFVRSGDSASYVWYPNQSTYTTNPLNGIKEFDSSGRLYVRTSLGKSYSISTSNIATNGSVIDSLPNYSLTFVGKYNADTLFNKVMDYNKNTFLNFPVGSHGWDTTGNNGIAASNFIGTNNNASLNFKTNGLQRAVVDSTGNIGFHTKQFSFNLIGSPFTTIKSNFVLQAPSANFTNLLNFGMIMVDSLGRSIMSVNCSGRENLIDYTGNGAVLDMVNYGTPNNGQLIGHAAWGCLNSATHQITAALVESHETVITAASLSSNMTFSWMNGLNTTDTTTTQQPNQSITFAGAGNITGVGSINAFTITQSTTPSLVFKGTDNTTGESVQFINSDNSGITYFGNGGSGATGAFLKATYLNDGAANPLQLGTNGIERLTILANGRFCLGRTTATQELEVAGQVAIDTLITGGSTDSIVKVKNGVLQKVSSNNFPTIVASNFITSQSAATNIITYTTGAADSSYSASAYVDLTALSVNVVQATITYTDETNTSRTATFFPMGATSATLALGNSNYPVFGEFRVKASTTITVAVTATGVGSETFNAGATITRLHN